MFNLGRPRGRGGGVPSGADPAADQSQAGDRSGLDQPESVLLCPFFRNRIGGPLGSDQEFGE